VLTLGLSPDVGKQVGKAVGGEFGQASQRVAQVGPRVDAEPLAGADHRVKDGGRPAALVAAGEQPDGMTFLEGGAVPRCYDSFEGSFEGITS
jgi:hypothetical protein